MTALRITTVQADLIWEAPTENLAAFSRLLEPLPGKTDLIVLPEMFTTGFSMNAIKLAESFPGITLDWMAEQAARCKAVIAGSIICVESGNYFNRFVWMRPDGSYSTYDKRHLFAYAGEHVHFSAGNERLFVKLGDWSLCPLICYDLRFPVWARNIAPYYDVLLYVANWPSPRRTAWQKLLEARAIENQSYVVGVNRVGEDANGSSYQGDSCVIDFMGDPLYQSGEAKEQVVTTVIQKDSLLEYRSKYPFLASAGRFQME